MAKKGWKAHNLEDYSKDLKKKMQEIKTFNEFRGLLNDLANSSFGEIFYMPLAQKFENLYQALHFIIREVEHMPARSGRPPSYRYMEGWLDGVRLTIKKIKKILEGENEK